MTSPVRFGTDGIRGLAGQYPLTPETVLLIGRAIGRFLARAGGRPTALIGRDTRRSGPALLSALAAGLLAEGVFVTDLGVMTTPGVGALTAALGADLGLVISASHNPAGQNGLKLLDGQGFKLNDAAQSAIEALIEQLQSAAPPPATSFAALSDGAALAALYIEHLAAPFAADALAGLRVALDCAHGAATAIAPAAFMRLGAEVHPLNAAPTGLNINQRAGSEYVRRQRRDLLAAVTAYGADLGVAFDGDADRVVMVAPGGALIDGDHILGLLAEDMQARGQLSGATVVATTMSNSGLEHFLAGLGVKLARTKVGDRHVMALMRQRGYALGGEQAGHIILLDGRHTTGDGVYTALLVAA